ncbi:MAG: redoxin domain-containing protein [Deltaproteobacteria bacterium]|nr:redoxin domain-containing protein [Deltaproteobacteria bacterium]
MTRRGLVGGTVGVAAALGAALGVSGRYGLGDEPDEERPAFPRSFEGAMPSFDGATGWINTAPLSAAGLRGKVVVVEFWTFSCINWRRQLPYVRAWADRYRDRGLVVIGVHTPEFGFERDAARVQRAADAMRITYPIAIDSSHAIWNAFHNLYWPALYFVDARGRIRHHVFGEGEYDASERVIRQLLAEVGDRSAGGEPVAVEARGLEAAPDWDDLQTSEIYVGAARAAPPHDAWSTTGAWTIRRESAVGDEAGARIVVRFHARDLHIVMGPARAGAAVRVRITLDGAPLGAARGEDVAPAGDILVTEPRLYQVVRQPGPVRDREVELQLLEPGLEVFSFTFG